MMIVPTIDISVVVRVLLSFKKTARRRKQLNSSINRWGTIFCKNFTSSDGENSVQKNFAPTFSNKQSNPEKRDPSNRTFASMCANPFVKKISVSPRLREIENTPPPPSKNQNRKRKPVKQSALSLKERIALAAAKKQKEKTSLSVENEEMTNTGLIPNPANKVVERVVDLKQLKRVYKIGCGLFGSVDCVKYAPTGDKYALKVISKGVVEKEGIIENLIQEKETLLALNSPFIIKLYSTLQSDQYCFFLLELVNGGEFYELLLTYTTFSEQWARFYGANVALAFDHMHQRGVVYRDLKPENVMLSPNGYLKLIDLGFAKIIGNEKTYTYCGTPDYLAPEMVEEAGHDFAVDWWALGVLIFEMLIGRGPFKAISLEKTCKMITSGKLRIPENRMSKHAQKIIKSLCKVDVSERLDYVGTRTHPWMSMLDWTGIQQQTVTPPYIPKDVPQTESQAEVPYENYVDNDGLFERF